ncbi:MAG TPA: cytochrome c oxidase subunit II [Gemmatimonadaceae bacterium]
MTRASHTRASVVLALGTCGLAGCGPLNVLARDGVTGSSETSLGWFLVIVACAVVLIVTVLVLAAWARSRGRTTRDDAVFTGSPGMPWITWGGIVIPAIVLVAAFLFTIGTLDAVAAPQRAPAATIQVIGHQWWWEVRYEGAGPSQAVVTANEIHVPVGEPVRLELTTNDVIHSFWVPELAGKTDLIPGQTNTTWIEARHAGVFGGTCGEYCGAQHAHMQLRVIAEPPGQFQQWLTDQRVPAPPAADPAAAEGLRVFMTSGCANCHTIRGTGAGGAVGPDLTHIASRTTIAAGALPNTQANLMGWIVGAPIIKPGSDMPAIPVPSRELQSLAAYLETLK